MRKFSAAFILVLSLCITSVFCLSGCQQNQSGSTIDEPEITGDYLSNEYSEQLVTDGAETTVGCVHMSKTESGYQVHLIEKDVIKNDNYDDGYYIADTNVESDYTLGHEARIACEDDDFYNVISADDFISSYNDDDRLYKVYIMGDSIELILSIEPEQIIE